MLKAVVFDEFSLVCPYFYTFGDGYVNGGYNCKHSNQGEVEDVGYKGKKKCGCCHCFSCPLGIEAEQQDLTDKNHPDAVKDEIDWDGLCEDGEVAEGEYLLVAVGKEATEEQKEAMRNYELHINRYNKKWLDEHGIVNSLCERQEENMYNLHSDFDIQQHKKTYTHYLEVIIDESGKTMYAVPSHQEMLIKLACEKLNVTREELNAMCPREYYFDLMTWLCKMSGACAVWEKFVQCDKLTKQQIMALQTLKDNGLYLGEIPKEGKYGNI